MEDERVKSFSITPLHEYCGEAFEDDVLVEISNDLLDQLVNVLVDFEYVDRIMRRLKSTRLAQDFQSSTLQISL